MKRVEYVKVVKVVVETESKLEGKALAEAVAKGRIKGTVIEEKTLGLLQHSGVFVHSQVMRPKMNWETMTESTEQEAQWFRGWAPDLMINNGVRGTVPREMMDEFGVDVFAKKGV